MKKLIKKIINFLFPPRAQVKLTQVLTQNNPVYDPAQDADRIMRGEVESYFD